MAVTWLHVSDFHLSDKGPYEQEVILRALVESVKRFREEEGRCPDLIFATGDIARYGKAKEYEQATTFFDELLDAAGLEGQRQRVFIIPGNHDVDRKMGNGLFRTLDTNDDADEYFDPKTPTPHLTQKFQAFTAWYDDYFQGIRTFPTNTTCSPVETEEINGVRLAVFPLNSALFCIDKEDHGKLFIGRRCLDEAKKALPKVDLTIAMLHHPLDWLSYHERSNITTSLSTLADVLLQGHLHEPTTEAIASASGGYLKLAAGAAYQTRKYPNTAMYGTFDGRGVTLFPIRYEDKPSEKWALDTSLYDGPAYTAFFDVPGRSASSPVSRARNCSDHAAEASFNRYRDALKSRFRTVADRGIEEYLDLEVPLEEVFVDLDLRDEYGSLAGRSSKTVSQDEVLRETFGGASPDKVLLLIGDPGSGKTTLLRHYAMLCLEGRHEPLFAAASVVRAIFIELRTLLFDEHNRPLPLAQQIVELHPSLSFSADEVEAWWRDIGEAERVLVLLDGLDEVTELEKRQAICRWIDQEGHAWPQRFMVVTSRKTGYAHRVGVELHASHRRATLDDLSRTQQEAFLVHWFKAASNVDRKRGRTAADEASSPEQMARELFAYLYPEEAAGKGQRSEELEKQKKGVQEIAGIPLLLKLMALLYKERHFRPDSRIALYRVVLSYLLHGREKTRQLSLAIRPEQSERVLALLAYTMQLQSVLDKSGEEMLSIMEPRFAGLNTTVGLDEFFVFMVKRSGILKPNGHEAYRFWHKTFQEYLASCEMARQRSSDDFVRSIVSHFDDRQWEWDETLRFYFAQIDADGFDRFMEHLFSETITVEVLQRKMELLQNLIRESAECSTVALCRKLEDCRLPLGVQWYVLYCLEAIDKPADLGALESFSRQVERFSDLDEAERRRLLDKAQRLIGRIERRVEMKDAEVPRTGEGASVGAHRPEPPRLLTNRYEYDAEYLLIRKGSFIYSQPEPYWRLVEVEIGADLYFARYPVTNKQYRAFIRFLRGDAAPHGASLSLESYRQALRKLASGKDRSLKGMSGYLKNERDLGVMFRSTYDDDRKFNKDDQPVVGVSWYAARAYCLWLSLLEGKPPHYRLPTEMEWEWAAGGRRDGSEENDMKVRRYPWGDTPEPTPEHANYAHKVGATTPVGSYPDGATPEGLYDMAGNIWEWTDDWYDDNDPFNYKASKALRGGSWFNVPQNLRCSARLNFNPDSRYSYIGFRVVRPSPFS